MQRSILIIVAAATLLVAVPCRAVTIIAKDREEPIKGYLISEDDTRVVVDELLPDGKRNRLILPKSAIDLLINPVSADRLGELSSDDPQAYRDYADELFEKREDPDARVTALRLYLISAWLDPPGQGRSCLLGMAALARDAGEERRFRAMAYLLDTDHDRSVLKRPTSRKVDVSLVGEAQRDLILDAIRALRSGEKSRAKSIARRPGFKDAIRPLGGLLSQDELVEAATEKSPVLKPKLLKRLLRVELLLAGDAEADVADEEDTRAEPWSQLIAARKAQAVAPLSLETVTEFDPRQSRFRGGKWVRP